MGGNTIITDFLVIGGGLGGICAAVQAARLGVDVCLAEKSLVLGGNSGPDGGVHPSGAHRFHAYAAETGVIEEITERAAWMRAKTVSSGLHYNSSLLWDEVLYQTLIGSGVRVFRNHYAREPIMDGARIAGVVLEDTGAYETKTVTVRLGVIDASGDGSISAAAGALWRMGREAKSEYNERSALEKADAVTMGSSLVALLRKADGPVPFIPPEGTPPFFPGYGEYPTFRPGPDESLRYFFPSETGGQKNTIKDEAEIYKEARRQLFSAWNYIKNEKYIEEAKNWELIWISPKLLKRESRRFVGDYTLTQNDVESGRVFDDAVAFGGFAEDIHYPREGMPDYVKITYIGIPPIYTIPFRCLYSKNIGNLLFASRLFSVSHIAHGTTRLQRTLAAVGQAVGCAAYLMKKYGVSPREVGEKHIEELRQMILREDGSIPGAKNEDERDLARRALVKATSERAFCAETAEKWVALDKAIGVMLWDFPKKLETVSFLLENNGSEPVALTAALFERAYPQGWQKKDQGSRQKGFPYEKTKNEVEWADDNASGIFKEIKKASAEIMPGQNRAVFRFDSELLEKKDTVDEERYLILISAAPGVKMAVNNRFCTWGRRAEAGDGEYVVYGDCPVVDITPKLPYGEAQNVTDGVNRRFSNNPLHMWQSAQNGKTPQILEFSWPSPQTFSEVHITFDTLERTFHEMPLDCGKRVSGRLVRDYSADAFVGGEWRPLFDVTDNIHRFRKQSFGSVISDRLRIIVKRVWDEESSPGIYEIRVY